jgi:hypothetical protein
METKMASKAMSKWTCTLAQRLRCTYFTSGSHKSKPKNSGVDLNIGDWVDCMDQVNAWCKAKVVDANASEVRVNYSGWSSRWDQWIVRHSTRLAEANTRTKGIDTGWAKKEQGYRAHIPPSELEAVRATLERLCLAVEATGGPAEEDRNFLTQVTARGPHTGGHIKHHQRLLPETSL